MRLFLLYKNWTSFTKKICTIICTTTAPSIHTKSVQNPVNVLNLALNQLGSQTQRTDLLPLFHHRQRRPISFKLEYYPLRFARTRYKYFNGTIVFKLWLNLVISVKRNLHLMCICAVVHLWLNSQFGHVAAKNIFWILWLRYRITGSKYFYITIF